MVKVARFVVARSVADAIAWPGGWAARGTLVTAAATIATTAITFAVATIEVARFIVARSVTHPISGPAAEAARGAIVIVIWWCAVRRSGVWGSATTRRDLPGATVVAICRCEGRW